MSKETANTWLLNNAIETSRRSETLGIEEWTGLTRSLDLLQ